MSASSVIAMWFPGKTRATAMAIWSTWVPVGMLIVFNGAPIVVNAFGIHVLWWIICALAIIATLLVAVFFRAPREDEAEISVQTSSLKSALPFLKSRQLIALGIAWLGFNYVNYCFVTFNVDFFQTGMGMNQSIAALIGSICSAAGIIAPLFGAVSDRINKNRKYLMIVFGCVGLLIAAAVGFQNATLSFWLFIIFQILGNSILVATCRPMAPMIVGNGCDVRAGCRDHSSVHRANARVHPRASHRRFWLYGSNRLDGRCPGCLRRSRRLLLYQTEERGGITAQGGMATMRVGI